jgi:hypothetical protein
MADPQQPKVAHVTQTADHQVSVAMPRHPPRLSVALLWAKPGQVSKWQTTLERQMAATESDADRWKLLVDLDKPGAFDAELGRLLLHVVERLENGLDEAWMSRWGYDAPSWPKKAGMTQEQYSKALGDALDQAHALRDLYDEPEEQWARAMTEMFVYAPYAGMGQLMLGDGRRDREIYAQWPKVYSLAVACQHLSTYGALGRGLPASDFGNGMTAGPNGMLKVFNAPSVEGAPKRAAWLTNKISDYTHQDLRPGDIASGAENSSQTGWAHCASVLRRWPLGKAAATDGSASKFQMIDTGVLAGQGDYNTQDHGWLDSLSVFNSAAADLRGLGKLPTPQDLTSAVAAMKKALPMGFVRLVILEKGGRARYASAMLPMWFGDARFTIASYLWSIRDLPAKEGTLAYWAVYAALGDSLFNEVVTESASPSRSGAAIYAAAIAAGRVPKGRPTDLRLVAVCTSEPRVLRDILKTDDAWKDVERTDESEEEAYAAESAGAGTNAPTQVKPFYDFHKQMLDYDALPEEKKKTTRAPKAMRFPVTKKLALKLGDRIEEDAWSTLQSPSTFAQELTVADTAVAKFDAKPMADRGVRYFNGTASPGK